MTQPARSSCLPPPSPPPPPAALTAVPALSGRWFGKRDGARAVDM